MRITFNPHHAPRVARLLDKTGIITITDDMTIKERGKIVIDAQNADGYAAYSTDIRYTAYDHQRAGTASGQPSPSEYQQMIAMAAEGVKSVNGVKPDENGDVQVQGGGVSDDQIKQVVSDYMTENPVTIPETLPNPNALTLTGAVEGTYDGSKPLEVEIPSGGIDIASAEVGQIIKVAAVDDNGKPTAWEAVDTAALPELIADVTAAEDTTMLSITTDSNGNAFRIKQYSFFITFPETDAESNQTAYIRLYSYGGGMALTNAIRPSGFSVHVYAQGVTADAACYDMARVQIAGVTQGSDTFTYVAMGVIDIVQLYTLSSDMVVPQGTNIKIYGVRV